MSKKIGEMTLGPNDPEPNYKQCQFCEHFYRFSPYNPYEEKIHLTPSNECSVRGFGKVDPLGPVCYMYKPNMVYLDSVKKGLTSYMAEYKKPGKKTKRQWKKAKVVETVGELVEALKDVDPDTTFAILFGAHKRPERESGFVSIETKDYTEPTPLELHLHVYKHKDGRDRTPTLLILNHGSDVNVKPNLGALRLEDLEDK